MTENQADFINVYFNDLKKEFETKKNLTKIFFDKIVETFMRKLEQQVGTSTQSVNRSANSSSINEASEIKRLIPERYFIRAIIKELVNKGRKDIAENYVNFYYMLPSDIMLQKIQNLPDVERQRTFSELQTLLQGVNPSNKYWGTILRENNVGVYMNSIPNMSNMAAIFRLYDKVDNSFMEFIRKEAVELLKPGRQLTQPASLEQMMSNEPASFTSEPEPFLPQHGPNND
jgi:hypothetical protein